MHFNFTQIRAFHTKIQQIGNHLAEIFDALLAACDQFCLLGLSRAQIPLPQRFKHRVDGI